jgi:hypothetical protein
MAGSGSNTLRAVLNELGWSYSRLAAELRRHASLVLPKTESMVTLISRWVNNHQQPDDFYRDLLSRATGRARAELFSHEPASVTMLPSGLVVARSGDGLSSSGEAPLSSGGDGLIAWLGQEPELKDGSVERRSFLASLALLGVDLTALTPASSAQAGSTGERVLTLDGALLRDLDLTTAAYERMRHRVPGRSLMRQVVGHIELTEEVLPSSLWPAQRQRLLANLSQTTSLLSWLRFFDQGDRAAARVSLMRSTRAAQESGDPELMVLAMIRGAEQQTYSCHGFWPRTLKPTRPSASWTRAWLFSTGRWTRCARAGQVMTRVGQSTGTAPRCSATSALATCACAVPRPRGRRSTTPSTWARS